MGILSYGYKAIKSVKPKAISKATKRFKAKVEATKEGVKKGVALYKKNNPKPLLADKDIKKIQKDTTEKHNKKNIKEYLREKKMGGGMMGRPMYKKGSKKAVGEKPDLGMQSVIYGLDNKPEITAADPKAKFIAKGKKA